MDTTSLDLHTLQEVIHQLNALARRKCADAEPLNRKLAAEGGDDYAAVRATGEAMGVHQASEEVDRMLSRAIRRRAVAS